MTHIVVTGAAGFIGSNLCQALLDVGHEVIGVDNFDPFYDRTIKEAWVDHLSPQPGFQFIESDIDDAVEVEQLLQGASAVVHLAALAGVRSSIADPLRYMAVNVGGTTAILEGCRRAEVNSVVVASSSSVYGERGDASFKESDTNLEPISPYAVSKFAGELVARSFSRLFGIRVAALRFFSVYGPRQRPDQAIHRFLATMSAGNPLECFGDGSASRDYTHVDDVVAGILKALDWVRDDCPACEVFNIGSSRSVSLDRLVEILGHSTGLKPKVKRRPLPAVDVRRTCASLEKANSVLGYEPRVTLEEGIAQFIRWYEVTYGH